MLPSSLFLFQTPSFPTPDGFLSIAYLWLSYVHRDQESRYVSIWSRVRDRRGSRVLREGTMRRIGILSLRSTVLWMAHRSWTTCQGEMLNCSWYTIHSSSCDVRGVNFRQDLLVFFYGYLPLFNYSYRRSITVLLWCFARVLKHPHQSTHPRFFPVNLLGLVDGP